MYSHSRDTARNAIETIIKEKHIDRNLFHEASKFNYAQIFRKFYYTFCTHDKYSITPDMEQILPYMWLTFRKNLTQAELFRAGDWDTYIRHLSRMVSESNHNKFYYLLTDGAWLYEGTLPAVIEILLEYPPFMEDFYLFPKNYEWVITHCDDGDCMTKHFAKSSNGT